MNLSEFKDIQEFEFFVRHNCRCKDQLQINRRTYFVNENPFLLHNYEIIYTPMIESDNGILMSANHGTFAYL